MLEVLLDPLSIEEIRQRLEAVKAQTPAWNDVRKPEFQHILRLRDIAAYIQIPGARIWQPQTPRLYQKELSWFFRLWDAGQLIKAKVDGRWTLVRRAEGVAQMAPQASTPGPPTRRLELGIDMTAAGPRLRRM